MKKTFIIFFVVCFSTTLFAQPTIVSTDPSNRNFILEEYTGTNCQFCPDGHRIAQNIMANNPGKAYAINIHQGGFSGNNPDYKTQWGDPLAQQYGINSYPAGTCNRGAGVVNRGQWNSQCNNIISQPSVVNVAAEGTVDWATRKLTLLVEVYYTGNATQTTNQLNIALLQNDIIGPQVGVGYNPDMIIGSQYKHMHMLRDFITDQWGTDVTPTTTGSFWSHTFEYNIPEEVRNVPVELEDIEILVFIAENQKTIITGTKANLNYINLPAANTKFTELSVFPTDCSDEAQASVKIKNAGETPITSLEFSYTVAGGTPETFLWEDGTISPITGENITIPVDITPNQSQNIKIDLVKVNNTTVSTLTKNINFKKELAQEGDAAMKLIINPDQYASETTFKVFSPNGAVLLQGGPLSAGLKEYNLTPTMVGCHRVEIYDYYGDGIIGGGERIKLLNSLETQIYSNNGAFGAKLVAMLPVNGHTITASAGENGTISSEGEKEYIKHANATYTFTPEAGYVVEEVYIDDEPMDMALATNYTFTAIDNDYTIHVTFKLIEETHFTITATAGENGTISPEGEIEYLEGENAEFVFIPDNGFEVEEVFIDGEPMDMAQATEYTFIELDKDYTIHVSFRKLESIKDVNGVAIAVAPNPVDDQLFVTGTYDRLEIISVTGQLLSTAHNQSPVDVSLLPKGIYFVKILTNGQTYTFKVVK